MLLDNLNWYHDIPKTKELKKQRYNAVAFIFLELQKKRNLDNFRF